MTGVTDSAVSAIKDIIEVNEDLNQIMISISAAIEEQQSATAEISRSVQFAAKSTQNVSTDINEVTQGAIETGAMSGEVLSASDTLDRIANDLENSVGSFCTEIQQMQNEAG